MNETHDMDPRRTTLADTSRSDSHISYPNAIEPDLGLRDLFRLLRFERRMIIAIVAATVGIGVSIALVMDPVYRAQTLLIPSSDTDASESLGRLAGQYGGLASLAGINLGGDSSVKTEALATLTSRSFLEDFVSDRNLLPVIFADKWNSTSRTWNVRDPDKAPTVADAARVLGRRIMDVSEDRKTGLITLSIDWTNREEAAEWANDIVARLNSHMRDRAIREAENSMTYLQRELAKANAVEIQQGIYRMIENEIGKVTVANVRSEFALRVVDPALTPTLRDKIRPKRLLILIAALGLGVVLATTMALLKGSLGGSSRRD